MKKIIPVIVTLLFSAALCGCDSTHDNTLSDTEIYNNSEVNTANNVKTGSSTAKGNEGVAETINKNSTGMLSVPEELAAIPREYYSPANRRGTLVELNYSTYESFNYEEHLQSLEKRAVENGEIKPLIIVCPTYNNTSSEDGASFGLALQ